MIAALARIKSYLDYGVFQPIQIASIIALRECEEDTKKICAVYQKRRDVLIQGLNRAGWPVEPPQGNHVRVGAAAGAVPQLGSLEFSKMLLEKALVAVSPGIGFGPLGEGYVRFALIENPHRTRQATAAIKKMLQLRDRRIPHGRAARSISRIPCARRLLVDLRDLQPEHLAPLLAEEIEAWRSGLDWDFHALRRSGAALFAGARP